MRRDRWVTWNVKITCGSRVCQGTTVREMAYPCLRLPAYWSGGDGKNVKMRGIEDAIMRVLLQANAQNIPCDKCRKGQTIHAIMVESVQLPALLIVSMARDVKIDVCGAETIKLGNLTYRLTGIAFFRPGHYTCSWRLDEGWYYYDDTKGAASSTTATAVPNGFTRRVMYYVRAQGDVVEDNFDGMSASQTANFSMAADGGVCQQEGTELLK